MIGTFKKNALYGLYIFYSLFVKLATDYVQIIEFQLTYYYASCGLKYLELPCLSMLHLILHCL